MDKCILLDTRALDRAIARKEGFIRAYEEINGQYDRTVSDLLKNWQGAGAKAFEKDAKTVKNNIAGIFDILKIMCDTLTDCKAVFVECDRALGDYNRNPDSEK